MKRVEGKIALITGASRGIGAATARLLAQEGAHVIVTDVLVDEGTALAAEINGTFYQLNVAQEDEWQSVSDAIQKKYGKIDILFNNAGITGLSKHYGPQDPEHITLQSWHDVHAINLDGVFLGCKYGIGLMKKDGGSIINMASRSGKVGTPDISAYGSSKAAVLNYTKSVALYCAEKGYNIRCNSVCPAAILTTLWDPTLGTSEPKRKIAMQEIVSDIPLGHMGEPLDVAYAVLYLASNESKYMTGAEMVIDGGILAGTVAALEKSHE
jgi:NAD(P)-dependent dehydrogenase (short-subunit alcohol dehydrogenase family)